MARQRLEPNLELSSRIKMLRTALVPKMSQERFAEEIGVDVNTFRNYELGKIGIPTSLINTIASKLKCCPESLYEIAHRTTNPDDR